MPVSLFRNNNSVFMVSVHLFISMVNIIYVEEL